MTTDSEKIVSLTTKSTTSNDTLCNLNDIEELRLCTCQQSDSFPLCDDSHLIFNKETNSRIEPLIIKRKDLSKLIDIVGGEESIKIVNNDKKIVEKSKAEKTETSKTVCDVS